MNNLPEIFGSKVFNDNVAKARLPKDAYKALKNTVDGGEELSLEVANVVANAMKDWAIENGATHFTHWFQPMTGITAEKHDSFINPNGKSDIIMEFSGKELVKGEPDASSFPSGGLRATFEARGYTSWDPSSFAFLKDGTLFIPTAFCSYSGEALDKKTPLLRSMDVLDKEATRLLKIIGATCDHVLTTVGPEQEYFLVDKDLFNLRPDLMLCGRTILGAKPPKGQDLDDHYFGALKPRVAKFMSELDEELWKFGIFAKTKHNEVAPCQHELATIFTTTNIAADNNQLVMEMMKEVADKNGFACLLAEKPFAYVNGSGKHNNWSLATNSGENLLNPGKNPSDNYRFLLLLSAVIMAVDKHSDLLRISVSSAGNDHRLGANEAPPAIVSMFLGDDLTEVLEELCKGKKKDAAEKTMLKLGAGVLPKLAKDTTDRNRTSPFAFTGNKFEFRMLGSSFSISDTNVVLNTIVTESIAEIADRLENSNDIKTDIICVIKDIYSNHKRIIFNGNNYSDEWVKEAEKRGLLNLKTTPDALKYFTTKENIDLFNKFNVLSPSELTARAEIYEENYSKVVHIEAVTMIDIVYKLVLPSMFDFSKELLKIAKNKKTLGISSTTELAIIDKLTTAIDSVYSLTTELRQQLDDAKLIKDASLRAMFNKDEIIPLMDAIRVVCDKVEVFTPKKFLYMPTYCDLLFSGK